MRCALGAVAVAIATIMVCGCGSAPLTETVPYDTDELAIDESFSPEGPSEEKSEGTSDGEDSFTDDGGGDIAIRSFDVSEGAELFTTEIDGVVFDYYVGLSEDTPAVLVMASGNLEGNDRRVLITGTVSGNGDKVSQTIEADVYDYVGVYGSVVTFDELKDVDGTFSVTLSMAHQNSE